jgi:hypothetical protein
MEIESDKNEFLLVVDGQITQKNTLHKLYLSRTTSYGYVKRNHVTGAEVRLYDETGFYESYYEDPVNEYYYLLGDQLERTPGKTYHVEIRINENSLYRSIPQLMPDVLEADSVSVRGEAVEEINDTGLLVEKRYVNVYITTPVNKENQDVNLIWRMDHVYSFTELKCHPLHTPKVCYIKKPVLNNELAIFTSENIEGGVLANHRVARIRLLPDWEYYEKHFYNVAQHSITSEAYEYWNMINRIAQPTGSIFDTPPAPIPGNIYRVDDPEETVLGFFEVSAVDTVRTSTNYADFRPLVIVDRCPYLNWQTYSDPPCCNCLTLDNSDTVRPDYWGE